jgi:hypothetical protein
MSTNNLQARCHWDAIAQRIEVDYNIAPIYWRFAEGCSIEQLEARIATIVGSFIGAPYAEMTVKLIEHAIEDELHAWERNDWLWVDPFYEAGLR